MKLSTGVRSHFSILIFLGLVFGIQACGGGNSAPPNEAPTATAVSITDDNAGTAEFGDVLSATYAYNDAESNAEGTTTFIWLRNGTAISGATASTYTLTVADTEQTIIISVTPVAATGIAVDVLPDQDGSGIYSGTANIDAGNTDIKMIVV